MTVKLYKKDLLKLLGSEDEKKLGVEISADLGLYKPYGDEFKKKKYSKITELVQSWTRSLELDIQDRAYENFRCDKSLPPGDYFAVAEASNIRHQSDKCLFWFTVTDLGIIVKQDSARTVVRAIDLTSLKPISGVSVDIRNREENLKRICPDDKPGNGRGSRNGLADKSTVRTGADGFAVLPSGKAFSGNYNASLVVCGFKGDQHAYGGCP